MALERAKKIVRSTFSGREQSAGFSEEDAHQGIRISGYQTGLAMGVLKAFDIGRTKISEQGLTLLATSLALKNVESHVRGKRIGRRRATYEENIYAISMVDLEKDMRDKREELLDTREREFVRVLGEKLSRSYQTFVASASLEQVMQDPRVPPDTLTDAIRSRIELFRQSQEPTNPHSQKARTAAGYMDQIIAEFAA